VGLQGPDLALDLAIAGLDLPLIEVAELQCLAQLEDVLSAVVSAGRVGDLGEPLGRG
jgi:hypothetical protein